MLCLQLTQKYTSPRILEPKPVDCVWGQWNIETCSKSCGIGERKKTRIKEITEMNDGTCIGTNLEIEECDNGPCPGISYDAIYI